MTNTRIFYSQVLPSSVQLVALDGRCSRPDVCADSNAICLSGFCVCDRNFAAQNATCGEWLSTSCPVQLTRVGNSQATEFWIALRSWMQLVFKLYIAKNANIYMYAHLASM